VDLYTFFPGAYECAETCFDELKKATEDADGKIFQSSDPDAIPSIINQIQKSQAEKMGAQPTVIRTDQPWPMFLVCLVALVAMLLVGWRSR
jgi:Ca-activated chloride channel family protein